MSTPAGETALTARAAPLDQPLAPAPRPDLPAPAKNVAAEIAALATEANERAASAAEHVLHRIAPTPQGAADHPDLRGATPRRRRRNHRAVAAMTAKPMLTLSALLRRGRERIVRGWVQHMPACDTRRQLRAPDDPAAVAWCGSGAVWYKDDSVPNCVDDPCYQLYLRALEELRKSLQVVAPDADYVRVPPWNDASRRTQADVVHLYDGTIDRVDRDRRHEDRE